MSVTDIFLSMYAAFMYVVVTHKYVVHDSLGLPKVLGVELTL